MSTEEFAQRGDRRRLVDLKILAVRTTGAPSYQCHLVIGYHDGPWSTSGKRDGGTVPRQIRGISGQAAIFARAIIEQDMHRDAPLEDPDVEWE